MEPCAKLVNLKNGKVVYSMLGSDETDNEPIAINIEKGCLSDPYDNDEDDYHINYDGGMYFIFEFDRYDLEEIGLSANFERIETMYFDSSELGKTDKEGYRIFLSKGKLDFPDYIALYIKLQ